MEKEPKDSTLLKAGRAQMMIDEIPKLPKHHAPQLKYDSTDAHRIIEHRLGVKSLQLWRYLKMEVPAELKRQEDLNWLLAGL